MSLTLLFESFVKTPKIVKSILSIGEIAKLIKEDPTNEYMNQVFDKMVTARAAVRNGGNTWAKTDGYIADGFVLFNIITNLTMLKY